MPRVNPWDEIDTSAQETDKPALSPKKESLAPARQILTHSVSDGDPKESVMNFAPTSIRMNKYQKDILKEAAHRLDVTKAQYIRYACTEYAREVLGIV